MEDLLYMSKEAIFQSTHPMRGATHNQGYSKQQIYISIHAPHEGCDVFSRSVYYDELGFQSTHPMRGATLPSTVRRFNFRFQSTHPMRGATATINKICVCSLLIMFNF